MSESVTRVKIAKALMDAALREGTVEYTGETLPTLALRTECYKLRSVLRRVDITSYDALTFVAVPAGDGKMALTIGSK